MHLPANSCVHTISLASSGPGNPYLYGIGFDWTTQNGDLGHHYLGYRTRTITKIQLYGCLCGFYGEEFFWVKGNAIVNRVGFRVC